MPGMADPQGPMYRLAPAVEAAALAGSDRCIPYILSDSSVARDGHRIMTAGWDLANYRTNPVFLWAHDTSEPPIGRITDLSIAGDQLRATVEYIAAEISPFADMVFRMVKGRFLNAVSVSWDPIEWKFAADKDRPGGIDFLRQDLLEVSQVPVPALAGALATARARGIDTSPLVGWAEKILDTGQMILVPRAELESLRREAKMPQPARRQPASPTSAGHRRAADDWKCGAARDLPAKDTGSWDGPAAAERMLDAAGFNGDTPDPDKAKRGFLAWDAANPSLKGSYKLPFADLLDGTLTAIKGGLDNAASRLSGTDVSDAVKAEAQTVIDAYQAKLGESDDARFAPGTLKRDLYDCGWLAMILSDLSWLAECVEWEATNEGDGSPVPAKLVAALKELGQVLIEMTIEEVTELTATGAEPEVSLDETPRAAVAKLLRRADTNALIGMATALRAHLRGEKVTLSMASGTASLARAGRVFSAENERCMREIDDHMANARAKLGSLLDQIDPAEPDDDDGEGDDSDEARALRARKARLAALRAARVTSAEN